ncbi:MAG: FG-GAP repeat domain-containing protein, partial [Saprospiraceae bacterium]
MKTFRLLFAAGFALPFCLMSLSLSAQTTHHVLSDFSKIHRATDAAQTGDIVLFSGAPIFSNVVNSPATTTPGDYRSVNWIDVDNDTDLDLFISNGPQGGANNFLYVNNGAGSFAAVTNDPIVQDGKPSDGATWADFDNDGDADCFVANWYGVNNLFYKN